MSLGVVVLAAGSGSRMGTDHPKVLQDFLGTSMVKRVIKAAKACNPSCLVVVHGQEASLLQAHLQDESVHWAVQQAPLGTGHAVLQALPQLQDCDRVMVLFADVPCLSSDELHRFLQKIPQGQLGVITAHYDNPARLGRIVRNEKGVIQRVVEYADATEEERAIGEVFTGVIVAPTAFLTKALASVGNDNAQGEYYLPDVLAIWAVEGGQIHGYEALDAWRMRGVNTLQQLSELARVYQRNLAHCLQERGVRIEDPDRFDCKGELVAEADVVIAPNVVFTGRVELKKGVCIESGVALKDTVLEEGVHVKHHSVVEDCHVHKGAVIGPFAHLRPGCVLESDSKVGAFVEMKNTHFGKGAKAGHLAYLGDAKIGSNVNIGAGVITCNYDGHTKHATTIEADAFIGTGTYLVAPVSVGKAAFVGAGTVVRKPVEAGALAVSLPSVKQVTGWVKQRQKERNA